MLTIIRVDDFDRKTVKMKKADSFAVLEPERVSLIDESIRDVIRLCDDVRRGALARLSPKK